MYYAWGWWWLVWVAIVIIFIYGLSNSRWGRWGTSRSGDEVFSRNGFGGVTSNFTPSYMVGRYTGIGPKNYRRSDERILEEVSDRLMLHGEIDASEVEVSVSQGEVTLSGTVESRRIKRMVEEVADSVAGVRDVRNGLSVGNLKKSAAGDKRRAA